MQVRFTFSWIWIAFLGTRMETILSTLSTTKYAPQIFILSNRAAFSINLCDFFLGKSSNMDMLLLSHFSCVRLCATPETATHQAPLSLGFSRQEHWSGLPFPSPVHESEKWKWNRSVMPTLLDPRDCSPQAPSSMGFSRQEYWSGVPYILALKKKKKKKDVFK